MEITNCDIIARGADTLARVYRGTTLVWEFDCPEGWYLVPVTDSESNPPAGSDFVFYAPLRSSVLTVVDNGYPEDSYVTITNDVPVTAVTGGEYLISDATYSGLTIWNLDGGIGGGFKVKGKTGDWFLRTARTTAPQSVSTKDIVLGAYEPTYFNAEDGKVYVNFVSQEYCWALGFRSYTGIQSDFDAPGGWKCSGAGQSFDYDSHLYLYRLVRKPL